MHHETDVYAANEPMDPSTPSVPKQSSLLTHSTVRLNQFTLQFEDKILESSYQALIHCRKKELWLRSLVPAAAFHVLFGMGDCLEHPPENLLVTIPARVFLAVLQASTFVLVRWDLIRATELTMLFVSLANGIPTLLIYALQRTSLHQWDALFVVFGLSFYTIPKITPLGFVASLSGSCLTGAVYALLALVIRPPPESFESLLGLSYAFSVTGIYNTISYYSEYNARERFVLRRRLKSESITLAMSRINTLPIDSPTPSMTSDTDYPSIRTFLSMLRSRSHAVHRGQTFSIGVLLWGFFTLGGWTSLPEPLKFVDEATGWAWFSHCAGVTAFLVIMTRQLQWLLVIPLVGSILLWMLSMTIPSYWIIISAHSVGYGLLFASIVVAMGVFSWFVCAWKELVSFVTRSCFLYPQLQAGLQTEYPLLVKIVSEYTAGMDPAIISSRDTSNQAVMAVTTGTTDCSKACTSVSPRRRNGHRQKTTPQVSRHEVLEHQASEQQALTVHGQEDTCEKLKMVSVLPSFTADKCFFCSKNEANHLIPVCGTWGKWTHWRMSQVQQSTPSSSSSSSSLILRDPKTTMMCTSYYDVQGEKSQLEQHIAVIETENQQLRQAVDRYKAREERLTETNVQLQAALRALEEKHVMEQQRQAVHVQEKVERIRRESNKIVHAHKLELRRYTEDHKRLVSELETERRIQEESRIQYEYAKTDIEQLRAQLVTLTSCLSQQSSVPTSPVVTTVNTTLPVHQSRRLPYARWIEIEGLRESARATSDKKY